MKKILCFTLCMILVCSMPVCAQITGAVYATDIHAYIDYLMVPSYNIDGYTAVIVRDLEDFGYTVLWDESSKTVNFYRDFSKPVTPTIPVCETRPVGTKLYDVYETDIKTYFRGVEIPSYNLGGRTAVRLRDIAMVGAASYNDAYHSADIFCFEAEYFDDEIAYIKSNFYENLLLLSKADVALQPFVSMLESGTYQAETVADFKAFFTKMNESFEAFKVFKEPYGFDRSAAELWWAMVNMRYACETALVMTDMLQSGRDISAAMNDYKQYRIDCLEQRRVALLVLQEEMMKLTFFWE